MSRSRILCGTLLGAAILVSLPDAASAGVVRTFAGTVFEDVDGDGTQDAGEPGIAGCTVELDTSADGDVDTTDTTDADGAYSVVQPSTDPADLDATCPGGLVNLTGTLSFATGPGSVNDADFAFFDPGQVFGDTFADTDGDGVQDAGEALLDGCTVTLDEGADGTVDDDTTTVDGFFFSGLGPGTVRLRATCPNLVQTTPNPADILVTSGLDQGGILFGFGQAPATTTTTAAVAATSTTAVLARTGATSSNGGLGLLAVGLLAAGGALVVLAGRRRAA